MLGAMLALLIGVSVAPPSVHVIPAEALRTTVTYDSGPRRLTLGCDSASRGACVFVVVDGRSMRRVILRARARTVVTGVSGEAKVCVRGRNPGATCDWTPVVGAAA